MSNIPEVEQELNRYTQQLLAIRTENPARYEIITNRMINDIYKYKVEKILTNFKEDFAEINKDFEKHLQQWGQ
jgi:hypothetical protein